MKRLTVSIAIGLLMSTVGLAHAQKGQISIPALTAQPGDKVTVPIKADANVKNVGGVQFEIDYSSVTPAGQPNLTVVSDSGSPVVNNGDMIKKTFLNPQGVQESPTMISGAVVGDPSQPGADGPGTLVSLDFNVPATAAPGTVYSLNLVPAGTSLSDPTGTTIAADLVGGTITVQSVPKASVSIGSGTATAGAAANVDVTLDAAAQGVAGATLVVNVGPDVTIDPKALKNGTIVGGTVTMDAAPVTGQTGQYTVTVVGSTAGNGPGTLVTLPLAVSGTSTGGVVPLTIVSAELRDASGNVIASQVGTGGTLTISLAPAGTLSLVATAAPQGGKAAVDLSADASFKDIGGLDIDVTYDPAVLSLPTDPTALQQRIVLSDAYKDYSVQANVPTPGTLKIALVAGANVQSGPGTILTVNFDVASSAAVGKSTVGLTVNGAVNSAGNTIAPATVNGGSLQVSPLGDLDGNGTLDIADIRGGLQLLFTPNPDPAKVAIMDADGNGVLDLRDLRILLRRILGLTTP